MLNNEVKKYLESLEQETSFLVSFKGEYDIAQKIKNLLKQDENYTRTKEDRAEQMAFDFMADYPNDDTGWGTYHGPLLVLPDETGQFVKYPSIRRVDQQMLEYWTKRAKKSTNPILSSRYADLVVDFSPKIINKSSDIDLIQIVINSNITICKKSLMDSLECKTRIKRALILAIRTNDQTRITEIKEAIIQLEKNIATDNAPGFWGFAFKWLILDFSRKIPLEEEEKDELKNILEDRLKRVEKNTWLAENAVSLLAEYYAREEDEKNLMRVLKVLENSLKTSERMNSDALLKSHAYERIHQMYREYEAKGFVEAKIASDRLSKEIGQLDLDWDKSLEKISVETKIPKEGIDNFLKEIFGENENDELEIVVARIAVNHIPKKDVVKKQLEVASSNRPIQFLCTKQIISDDGVQIAKLSTLEEDYDNNFQVYALQYIQLNSFFLSLAMDELKKRFSKQRIVEYFEKSALFENENKDYLEQAISAYWDNNYLVSSHLFNPLIESGVRELIKICGGTILKPNTIGGYNYVSLHALLKNNDEIFNIFSKSRHNISFYFRLVLTEKLGMNLRNCFAHGLEKNKFFGRDVSDRLFHILILLSLVTNEEKNSG